MSDAYIAADPDLMKKKAQAFDQQADLLKNDGNTLATALERIGNCWGSDTTGQAFEAQYKQNADQLTASIPNIVQNVHDVANGIRAQASAYNNQNVTQ